MLCAKRLLRWSPSPSVEESKGCRVSLCSGSVARELPLHIHAASSAFVDQLDGAIRTVLFSALYTGMGGGNE